jgi:hypothetical protein
MAECENCGAPDDGEHVMCKYCKSPITKDLLSSAIACPVCKAPNRAGRSTCSSCNGSLLLTCLFCGHESPASMSDCQKCGEAFAGAAERKKTHDTEHMLGAVGSFVTNLVGAASGGAAATTTTTTTSTTQSYSSNDSGSNSGKWGGSGGSAPPMDT